MLIWMTAFTWMVRNIPNLNTIEDFTEEIDEAEFVTQYNSSYMLMNMLYLCVALMNLVLGVAPFFELGYHGGINTTLCREVGQLVTGRRQCVDVVQHPLKKHWVPSTRRVTVGNKPMSSNAKYHVTSDLHLSLLPEFWETTAHM